MRLLSQLRPALTGAALTLAGALAGLAGPTPRALAATPPASTTPAAPAPPAPGPGISAQGNQLFRNGAAWIPRGVQIVGLVAPDPALSGKYIAAHAHFGSAELQAAVADHADVVRFQVSQFGIDPDGPLYSPAYVREVQDGVEAARALGLAVIVSLQAEPPAGEPVRCPLPDGGSQRAWQTLAGMFGGDDEVMFELYNEPAIAPTAVDWNLWRNGGEVLYPNGSCEAVGMQTLVDDIRAQAPTNVIIVPGLAGEQTLGGMPPIADPANPRHPQLAYGIHYPSLTKGSTTWDRAFGDLTARVPVLVTEWDDNSTTNCVTNAPSVATQLLDYLASKRIGVVGFAFDLPGTIVTDWSGTPTSYTGFACGAANGGPGQLLFGNYSGEAAADDGTSPVPTPAWVLTAGTLARLHTLAPGTVARLFDTPRTFVAWSGATAPAALGAPAAVPTRTFADANRLLAAVDAHTLPPGTAAVAYTPTHSRATPGPQQHNPAAYFKLAAAAAHAAGLLFVAAPSATLVTALAPRTPAPDRTAEFLKLKIMAGAARGADAVEIPSQGLETSPSDFGAFLTTAAAQAGAAHPGVELLAGLSAGRAGGSLASPTVLRAYLQTPASISGFALSDTPGVTADQGLAFLLRLQGMQDALTPAPATP